VREAFHAGETERLDEMYKVLDPVQLLQQIGTLQDALWRQAILRNRDAPAPNYSAEAAPEIRFEVSETDSSTRNGTKGALPTYPEENRTRKYHRTRKIRRQHDWRTRKDPFESVWGEIVQWLEANPERTAKSVFDSLQAKYPGRFTSGQLRTLQRRVQTWRAGTILAFDDQYLQEEKFGEEMMPPRLAVIAEKGALPPSPPGV
jgi:hypothetical protein